MSKYVHDYLQAFCLNQRLKDLGEEKLVKLIEVMDGSIVSIVCWEDVLTKKGVGERIALGFPPSSHKKKNMAVEPDF